MRFKQTIDNFIVKIAKFIAILLLIVIICYLAWCYESLYYDYKEDIAEYDKTITEMENFYQNEFNSLTQLKDTALDRSVELNEELNDNRDEYESEIASLEEENWKLRESVGFIYNKNIPLSLENQYQVFESSIEFEIPQELIIAVIQSEGGFEDNNYKTKYIGPMAVSLDMQDYLTETIGLGSLYDFKENIRGGTYFLRYHYDEYKDWHMALIAYNCGGIVAESEFFSNGIYYSDYSVKVLDRMVYWKTILEES